MRQTQDMHKVCTTRKGGAFVRMSCASACALSADDAARAAARAALPAAGMT